MSRTTLALALAVAACSYDKLDPVGGTPAPFGLDTRPANPTCLAKPRPALDTGVKLERQWPGVTFDLPMYLLQAPGDDATWYVVERGGKVRKLPAGATTDADVSDFASVVVNGAGEGGLLGMAFHPQWPAKKEAYLSYTRTPIGSDPATVCAASTARELTSVISRLQSSTGATLDGAPDEILKVGQPYTNHKGGTINFGPDNYLYFGLGDGGSGGDPCGSGQNKNTLLGKILRLDVDAPAGTYKIPADNPFVGVAGARPEIWSYGHRNPFRWSFDQATGDLWVGEVGQSTWEEVDRIVKGGNFGWNVCEGFHRQGSTTALCNTPGFIDPVVEHGRAEAQSITGGAVYRGSAMPSLVGTYIYGDYVTGNIWALTYDTDNKPVPKVILTVPGQTLVAFGQGHDGELYTVQISGTISKIVPAATGRAADDFPQKLSATGCVDPGDPTQPSAGAIPYDVASPLWSDGAAKSRYLAIPDGQTITVGDDGDWDLPIGSVAMKTFAVGGKRIETRLFMRHDDGGWAGYTYEWDADGKDATLLPAGKNKAVSATQMWAYPSRNQCIQCHSRAAGGTIGLETAQLNGDAMYPSTHRRSNQLATLDHIGMFTTPLAAPDTLPALAPPAGAGTLEDRARAYLHANCAHCHRPDGGGQGTMDLRYTRSLADTRTCNATNTQGPIGDASKLIVPGDPAHSLLSVRLHATDGKRMPPVGVSITDDDGAKLIDDWITSLTACP
jgi:uncharacterized repeat protein (TIGR03806 family)